MTKITDLTAAAPDSADVIPYVDVSDTTEDAAGTAKKATVQQIVDAATVDAATLTYSGDGVAISINQASETSGHRFWEYVPAHTPTLKWHQWIGQVSFPADPDRDDVTWNWGYNQGGQGGVVNNADSCFYLQLENHYDPGSGPQYEYHLNWYSADGQSTLRPFQVNVHKATGATSWFWQGGTYFFNDIDGNNLLSFGATEFNFRKTVNIIANATVRDSIALLNVGSTSNAQYAISANGDAARVNIQANPTNETVTLRWEFWGAYDFRGASFDMDVDSVGFYGTPPIAKPTVSGARDDGEGALASLLTALNSLGLITNSTTAT